MTGGFLQILNELHGHAVDNSQPAVSQHPNSGHLRRPFEFFFIASRVRRVAWTLEVLSFVTPVAARVAPPRTTTQA